MLSESDEDLLAGFNMQMPGGAAGASARQQLFTSTGSAGSAPVGRTATPPPGWQPPPQGSAAYARMLQETEARCSRLLADAESRILDERHKGKQREMHLREDILKEQSRGTRAAEQRARELLEASKEEAGRAAELEREMRATTLQRVQEESALATADKDMKISELSAELARLKQELATIERRHQEEKRELLSLRTNQLRLESSKKGQEGDLVARAMQALAEYERAVRQSESENSERLAAFTAGFARDWLERTRTFEGQKQAFEGGVMERALRVLRDHEVELDKREQVMRAHMTETLRSQSTVRGEQDKRVAEQLEHFKTEYKQAIDRDFDRRCILFDQAIELKEAKMLERLKVAREDIIRRSDGDLAAAEQDRVKALHDAMQQVSQLRTEVLADIGKRQQQAQDEIARARSTFETELKRADTQRLQETTDLRAQLAEAIRSADRALVQVEGRITAREAELHTKYLGQLEATSQVRAEEELHQRERAEGEFRLILDELQDRHAAEMKRVTDDALEARDRDMAEAQRREQELRQVSEEKLRRFESSLAARFSRQVQTHEETEKQMNSVIAVLRNEVSDMQALLDRQRGEFAVREDALQLKWANAQQSAAEVRSSVEEELRAKMDAWFEHTLGKTFRSQRESVDVAALKQQLLASEARRKAELEKVNERWGVEREEIREAATMRLSQEQAKTVRLEAELMDRVAEMRVELEAEAVRQQQEASKALAESQAELEEEKQRLAARFRHEKAEIESREHETQQARWERRCRDLQEQCETAVAQREERLQQRQAVLEKREAALRDEKLQEARKLMEGRRQLDCDIAAARAELDVELRAEYDARLESQREQMREELQRIRQRATEQEKAMEQARLDQLALQAEERAQAEEEARARADEIAERTLQRLREELRQREAELEEREANLRNQHEKEIAESRRQLRVEKERLQREADNFRAAWESGDQRRSAQLSEELQTIRREAAAEKAASARQIEETASAHQQELDELRRSLDVERRRIEGERRAAEDAARQQAQERISAAQHECQMRLQAETDALRQRELKMLAEADAAKAAAEVKAEERARELIEARAAAWSDLEEQRRRAATSLAEKVKAEIAARDAEIAIRGAGHERELLARVDGAMREHRAAAERKAEKGYAAAAAREEVEKATRKILTSTVSLTGAEETACWEGRISELRVQHAAEMAAERKKWAQALEAQLQDQREAAQRTVAETRAAMAKEADEVRRQHDRERELWQNQLVRKEEEAARMHVAIGSEAQGNLERHLGELRENYERRIRERDEADKERAEQAARKNAEAQRQLKENHDTLMSEADRRHQQALEEGVRERRAKEKAMQQELSELRHELEVARIGGDEAQAARKVSEVMRKSQEEITELLAIVEKERVQRESAERQQSLLRAEVERLESSMAQYKLDIHKQVSSKYEGLFKTMQSQSRADRDVQTRLQFEESQVSPMPSHPGGWGSVMEREREATGHFRQKWEKLRQLWAALETSDGERAAVADTMVSHIVSFASGSNMQSSLTSMPESLSRSPPRHPIGDPQQRFIELLQQLADDICVEVRRIEAQLPLMEVITRREWVKHRITELRSLVGTEANAQESADLRRELYRLDDQLLRELSDYEDRYKARLFYRNTRYLHQLQKETAGH